MRRSGNGLRAHGAMSALAVFLTIVLFTLLVFALTILGAKNYRSVVDAGERNANDRILQFYIAGKLRAAENASAVAYKTDSGLKVIEISETGESLYLTRIYCSDGYLMESYGAASEPFDPARGERLCPARALDVLVEDGLWEITITAEDGSARESCVNLAPDRG